MLIERIKCPHGCDNATFLESTRYVKSSQSNLLQEASYGPSNANKKIKSYTCNCCNSTFEIHENDNSNNNKSMILG